MEWRRLDPMSNANGSFWMPPNVQNENYGSDGNDDNNDNECDGDNRSKK